MRKLLSVVAGLVVVAAGADGTVAAQSVTVGHGTVGGCYPFGCTSTQLEYEQIFSSSFTSSPLVISTIAFKLSPDNPGGLLSPATYSVYFSTTATPVSGITTDLAANVTGAESLFGTFDGTGAPLDSIVTLSGSSSFAYDPSQGNLLMHIFASPNGVFVQTPATFSFFQTDQSGQLMSRAFNHTGINHDQLWTDNAGLVTSFNGAEFPPYVSAAPEPSSIALLVSGLLGIIPAYRRRRRVARS